MLFRSYSNGGLHFDIEGKRAWGDDYHLSSLPKWAEAVIAGHLQGKYLGSVQNIQPIETTAVSSVSSAPTNIPNQERKTTKPTNNVIVTQQNSQVNSVVVKKNPPPTNAFGGMSPQDAASYGIRGY